MSATFGGTLTGGIQDISALLTLIGTEQCEKHIGSALDGGYLYVAATVLSLFGSLGIVKAGIAVLIASMSFSEPSFSFSFKPFPKLSLTYSGRRFLGARVLNNAGFQLPGTVSPKIGIDAGRHLSLPPGTRPKHDNQRYLAETLLLQNLEEKHIDDVTKLSLKWTSVEWNTNTILTIIIAAAISSVPYIHLFLRDLPDPLHALWVFPFLRTMGSCIIAVSTQFIIQSRIISLMKSRIIFMVINQLHSDDLRQIQTQYDVRWDENLPAEECLESLEWYLCGGYHHQGKEVNRSIRSRTGDVEKQSTEDDTIMCIHETLEGQYEKHCSTSTRDRLFIVSSWISLLLGIPVAITGYIGCFTLVAKSGKPKGPLIWLGLEAALSILRILLWAWNPSFDERTEVMVQLELSSHPPLITTEKSAQVIHSKVGLNILPLVPEREFLQHITPYTGPHDQFSHPENIALYYTLTGSDCDERFAEAVLCTTVLDMNKRTAFTLTWDPFSNVFVLFGASVSIDAITGELQAVLPSEPDDAHLQSITHPSLIDSLVKHHISLFSALNRTNLKDQAQVSSLRWSWSLFPKPSASGTSPHSNLSSLSLSGHDQLYLKRGYEHHLKTSLMENWGKWIVDGMEAIRCNALNDCYHILADPSSQKGKSELVELEAWLSWERVRSELTLLESSSNLETILYLRMKDYIEVVKQRGDKRLERWLGLEFDSGRRKRLEREREQAKKRLHDASCAVTDRLKDGGRHYLDLWTKQRLEDGLNQIDRMWRAVIRGNMFALDQGSKLIMEDATPVFVEQLEQKFRQQKLQRDNEQFIIAAIIEQISDARFDQLDQVYQYPPSSRHLATAIHSKFVNLALLKQKERTFAVEHSSATVYDLYNCGIDIVRDVVQKNNTRSAIRVTRRLVREIPDNDHLLYIGGQDAPKFVEQNRERWWQQAEQQKGNSWTFYLSPEQVGSNGQYVFNYQGTIAHIMIFIRTPTYIRLQLVHCRIGQVSVSIREPQADRTLHTIHPDEVSEGGLRLQDFNLGMFEAGRHELELCVEGNRQAASYGLRDILVQFCDLPPHPSDGSVGINSGDRRNRQRGDN